jgi:hypothetical protein
MYDQHRAFEHIDEKIDIEKAGRRAEEVLARDAIKPHDFIKLYGQENVHTDEEWVRKREAEIAATSTPETQEALALSRVFEAIIHLHAELSDWFGPRAHTIRASRYDDLKNGVDEIMECQLGRGAAAHLALAIDVTFSPNIRDKFERIREEIDRGELATVKYFHSEYMHFRGQLSNVPRVIIGADCRTVKELADLWLNDKKRKLGEHQIQFQILEEILSQLKTFRAYAEQRGKTDLVDIYERAEGLVVKIWEQKRKALEDNGLRDNVFASIKDYLKEFDFQA